MRLDKQVDLTEHVMRGARSVVGMGFRTSIYWMQAERHEVHAGYTTLYGARYRHLWQLDPRTGVVIRPPEPR